jgi:GNAT superfamily N-acetyltransferase
MQAVANTAIKQASVEDLWSLVPLAEMFRLETDNAKHFDSERFVSFWDSMLESGVGVIFILQDEDGPSGAIGGVKYPEPYSGDLIATEFFWYCKPSKRGDGLWLYGEFEEWARREGCTEIRMVHLSDSMPERLRKVYRHWGFSEIETHYAKELRA